MFNSVFFVQIQPNLTKKNFEMYLRAGKTNTFSLFHVQNVKIQSMLWFYVRFNVEMRVIWVKNKNILRFMYVFYDIINSGKKGLILSKILKFYANKCLILFYFSKLTTIGLKRTLKCTSELEKIIHFQIYVCFNV